MESVDSKPVRLNRFLPAWIAKSKKRRRVGQRRFCNKTEDLCVITGIWSHFGTSSPFGRRPAYSILLLEITNQSHYQFGLWGCSVLRVSHRKTITQMHRVQRSWAGEMETSMLSSTQESTLLARRDQPQFANSCLRLTTSILKAVRAVRDWFLPV